MTNPNKPILYHGTAAASDHGVYSSFPPELTPRPQKTFLGDDGKFVFATPNFLKAVAYSLKARIDDRSVAQAYFTLSINGIPIMILGIGRNTKDFAQSIPEIDRKFLLHPIGAVFQVSNDDFRPILRKNGSESGEWVSEKSAKIELAEIITAEEAMKKGVQILLVEKEKCYQEEEFKFNDSKNSDTASNHRTERLKFFKRLIEFGILKHVNAEKNINPINYDTGKLEDMSYVEGTKRILAKSIDASNAFEQIINTQGSSAFPVMES